MYNAYSYISLNILEKDLASVFGYAILEVVSDSMVPTINKGDLIVINTNDQDYKEKSIVTFKDQDDMIVTHRIVEINDGKMTTRGDANNSDDSSYITKKDVIGIYVFKISNFGYVIKAIKNPVTLVSILIMGLIVCTLLSTDKDGVPLDISEEEKKFLISKEKKEAREKNKKKNAKKKQKKKQAVNRTKDSNNKKKNGSVGVSKKKDRNDNKSKRDEKNKKKKSGE